MIDQPAFNRRAWMNAAAASALAGAAGASSDATEHPAVGSVLDAGGIRVGHCTDRRRPTGCTVLLFDNGAVAGVDVRGSAPGTRETDLLQPVNTVQKVNALVLSGGSAYGLDTATGVMRYLEEKGQGYHMGPLVVPIVPAAILFDLNVGDGKIRPDANAGYAACLKASSDHVPEGSVGAGAGATVGKFFGSRCAMKSGLGTSSLKIGQDGLVVGALVAVNAVGDVYDRRTGAILAGALTENGSGFRRSIDCLKSGELLKRSDAPKAGSNTTIGVIVTNAKLTKTEMTKIAQMAHDGFARTINPTHTPADGDTVFAACTGTSKAQADVMTIGAVAAEAMADAVERAVLMATAAAGYRARRDLAWLSQAK